MPATGCNCEQCSAGKPHGAADELVILRALRNDPPAYPPVARGLKRYDTKPVEEIKRVEPTQPWMPRPARRAA